MKTVFIFSWVLLSAFPFYSIAQLEVTVKNLKGHKGCVRVGLFSNADDFLEKPVDGRVVAVTADSVTVIFENLGPGDYAISAIHDRNDNGKLDVNSFGIPKEGFGFGNNAMGTFGPPTFEKAKIVLKGTRVKQILSIKYFY